jgi:hypothetical protein
MGNYTKPNLFPAPTERGLFPRTGGRFHRNSQFDRDTFRVRDGKIVIKSFVGQPVT